jgi:hypothetical protein
MPDTRECKNPACKKSLDGRRPNAQHCGAACRSAAYRVRMGLTPLAVQGAFEELRSAIRKVESLVRKKV